MTEFDFGNLKNCKSQSQIFTFSNLNETFAISFYLETFKRHRALVGQLGVSMTNNTFPNESKNNFPTQFFLFFYKKNY